MPHPPLPPSLPPAYPRGYDVYTPHRSVVYHDYNHGPSTVAAASWTRDGKELEVGRGGGREGGRGEGEGTVAQAWWG